MYTTFGLSDFKFLETCSTVTSRTEIRRILDKHAHTKYQEIPFCGVCHIHPLTLFESD